MQPPLLENQMELHDPNNALFLTPPKMAISLSKKKSRQPKRVEPQSFCFSYLFLIRLLYRIPVVAFLLILVFLWSSSSTIISGRIVHVCVSSRKLNNLYCLSAGTDQPNFDIPILPSNSSSGGSDSQEVSNAVLENPNPVLESDAQEVSKVLENPNSVSRNDHHEVSEVVLENPSFVSKNGPHDVSEVVLENQNPISKNDAREVSEVLLENPNLVSKNNAQEVLQNLNPVSKTDPQEVSEVVLENPNPVSKNDPHKVSVDVVETPNPAPLIDSHEASSPVLENPNPVSNSESQQVSNVILENPNSFFYKTNFGKDRDEDFKTAVKEVEEQLKVHRSWKSNQNHQSCNGRGIYVYDLPAKFNKDLLNQCGNMTPWVDFCKYFSNDALGEPIHKLGKGWFQTHQYSLELIFHSRVLKHPCRVYDQNEAKLFYVPFYGGLDILRWHFKNVSSEVKDSLGIELVRWLEMQKPWDKNSGKDHVFILGKISWDFRRHDEISKWGTKLLELDEMQNPIKVLIERQPWEINDIGIPHPTHFHPHSDDEISSWQRKIISSNRRSLVSFAGAARPGAPDNIRSILINQCTSTTEESCRFLNCSSFGCAQPESIIELFMDSEFCLQPPGDSPTRKSVFDSLISGCIPVIFDPFTAYYQYPWHLPEDHEKYSVFIDQEDVRGMKVDVVERLKKVSLKERDDMRRYIVYEIMPGLVYGDQDAHFHSFQDAFAITMNNLVERVTKLD